MASCTENLAHIPHPRMAFAERKLRHILETGLTLLAHSHLSNKYWIDAFLTAVYIINRLPTPTLQYKSPYLKLYKHEPDYQNLRVFGCLVILSFGPMPPISSNIDQNPVSF
jgi:2-polyprenyl-3-methyl-5-hydroxy-6-metoxy-1,4-benzoquinol methylase